MTKPAEWPTKGQAVNPYEIVGFVVLFFVVVIKKKKKKRHKPNLVTDLKVQRKQKT